MNTSHQTGFTIIELMLAIAVATITLAIGVPSFVDLVRNNAAVTEVNDLVSALNLARSEAAGRGVDITVAPLSGTDWSSGWVVGIDADGDNVFPESGEPILRSFTGISSTSFAAAPARLQYKPTGEVNALASFTMVPQHCDNIHSHQRQVTISLAGHVDLIKQSCP